MKFFFTIFGGIWNTPESSQGSFPNIFLAHGTGGREKGRDHIFKNVHYNFTIFHLTVTIIGFFHHFSLFPGFLHSQIFLIFRFSWSLAGNARNRQQATTWCLQVPYMPMIIMTILINANDYILYLNCWFSDPTDLSRGGDSFVGKLRSNMLGTQVGTEDDSHMMLMMVIVMVYEWCWLKKDRMVTKSTWC